MRKLVRGIVLPSFLALFLAAGSVPAAAQQDAAAIAAMPAIDQQAIQDLLAQQGALAADTGPGAPSYMSFDSFGGGGGSQYRYEKKSPTAAVMPERSFNNIPPRRYKSGR